MKKNAKKYALILCVFLVLTFLSNAQNTYPAASSANEGATLKYGNYWSRLIGGTLQMGAFNRVTQSGDGGVIYGGADVGTGGGFVIAPWTGTNAGLRMNNKGLVTVSTNSPNEGFRVTHINDYWVGIHAGSLQQGSYNAVSKTDDAGIIFGGASSGTGPGFVIAPWGGAKGGIRVNSNGTVSIGLVSVTPVGYNLYVDNGILTEKVKVAISGSAQWADYVFHQEYKLPSLQEVEKYIQQNKHLPNIPSAEEMVKEGNDLGATDAKLLAKIEELTLYLIEQQKQITEMRNENEKMAKHIEETRKENSELRIRIKQIERKLNN
jgi:hypothetical protein